MVMAEEFGLITPRLRLRPLEQDDAEAFHACVTEPEIGRMLFRFPPDWPMEAARKFMDDCAFRGGPDFRLAIEGAEGRFIGSIGVSDHDNTREPEVFYFLAPSAAGKGYAREALAAFSDALFERFDIDALCAGVFTDNPASERVLTACGYAKAGQGMYSSPARLAASPVWHYRLERKPRKLAP